MDRRAFLVRLGALGAMGTIAACGGGAVTPSGSAAASATASAAATKFAIKLGQVSVSAANSAIWSANDGGFLTKYGLDATIVNIADSTQGVAAMVSGEVPINCGISGTAVISSAIGGSDLAFYAVTVNTFPGGIYAQKNITSIKDLVGKKLGVSRIGTASDTGGRIVLRKNGIDPKQVTILGIGGIPETLTALKSGQIDAGVLSPPTTLQARDAGLTLLVDMGQMGIEYAYNGVVTSRAYYAKHPDVVENTVKALIEGLHKFRTDATFGKGIIQKWNKLTNPAEIDETYNAFAKSYLHDPPFPTDAGIQAGIDELAAGNNPKAAGRKPSEFYDLTVMNKLRDSGFIKQIEG